MTDWNWRPRLRGLVFTFRLPGHVAHRQRLIQALLDPGEQVGELLVTMGCPCYSVAGSSTTGRSGPRARTRADAPAVSHALRSRQPVHHVSMSGATRCRGRVVVAAVTASLLAVLAGCSSGGSTDKHATMIVSPARVALDQPVQIRLTGVTAGQA